jgi:hypothetical protein
MAYTVGTLMADSLTTMTMTPQLWLTCLKLTHRWY